jgi:tRNA threonylcarbamoyladenosine biosynthesis protein TsaB
LRILAIDTTTVHGSIAITDDERVVEEVALDPDGAVAEAIFGEIEKLLERHSLTIGDIDGFAAATGPGTFTGVRVGLTAVKGLAEALSRQVVGVSNLKAAAWFGTADLRAPMLDARRGDVYGAVYDGLLKLVQDEVVMKREAWIEQLPVGAQVLSDPSLLAAAIGRIAAREFAAGYGLDPAVLDANYVRRSDAELAWRDVR